MIAHAFQSRRNLTPIGIDFGHTAIRAVQLRRVGQRYDVVAAMQLNLRSSKGGEQRQGDPMGMARRLRRAMSQHDFRGAKVILGLSAPDIEVHPMAIPMPADSHRADEQKNAGNSKGVSPELDQAARMEARRLAGFDTDQVETDWWPVPPGRGTDTTAIGVAVRTDQVTELCELCAAIGLHCQSVDVAPCAAARFGYALYPPADDHVWALLDVGARSTRLTICIDDVPVLVRAVDAGGQEWTRRIADALEVSIESAEILKRDHGLHPSGRGIRRSTDGSGAGNAESPPSATTGGSRASTATRSLTEVGALIYSVLKSDLDKMAKEIERSYAYVLESYPDRQAGSLLFIGSGAGTKNLDGFLSERLGVMVADVDSLRSKEGLDRNMANLERMGPFACAAGLALGA